MKKLIGFVFYVLFAGAINQLNSYLACEWAKDNIRCNCVAPWYTKTSLVEHVILFPAYGYTLCGVISIRAPVFPEYLENLCYMLRRLR